LYVNEELEVGLLQLKVETPELSFRIKRLAYSVKVLLEYYSL